MKPNNYDKNNPYLFQLLEKLEESKSGYNMSAAEVKLILAEIDYLENSLAQPDVGICE